VQRAANLLLVMMVLKVAVRVMMVWRTHPDDAAAVPGRQPGAATLRLRVEGHQRDGIRVALQRAQRLVRLPVPHLRPPVMEGWGLITMSTLPCR
jgi:hypothetical protein